MSEVSWTKRLFDRAFSKRTATAKAAARASYSLSPSAPAPAVVTLTEQMVCAESPIVSAAEVSTPASEHTSASLEPVPTAVALTPKSDHVALSAERVSPPKEEVEKVANEIWLELGCPEGHALEHWLMAEARLAERAETKAGTGR